MLSFGVQAESDTAVPGSIWQQAATTSGGPGADICLDDTGNGNDNAVVQVYQCNSDLAQYWVYTSQNWDIKGAIGHAGEIVNGGGKCLTAAAAVDHTQFTVASCTGAKNQQWIAPAQSAA